MPQATVAAIVTVKDGDGSKVLLTRRNGEPFKGLWCLPGGHIDRDEPARDAIVREVKEETGLAINARFFGCFDEIIPEQSIHAVVVVFEGVGIGTLDIQASEVEEARWFSIPEARRLRLAFKHNDILSAYGVAKLAAH